MPRKISMKGLREKAWDACSLYVRQLYSDHRGMAICYTCGKSDQWKYMDAGHGIPGRHNSVLFDTDIIRCQCKMCNVWKRGQLHIFTAKLINEHGIQWWEQKEIDSRKTVKFYRMDYERLIHEFTDKANKLILERHSKRLSA